MHLTNNTNSSKIELTEKQIRAINNALNDGKRLELTKYKDGTVNIATVERKRIEY